MDLFILFIYDRIQGHALYMYPEYRESYNDCILITVNTKIITPLSLFFFFFWGPRWDTHTSIILVPAQFIRNDEVFITLHYYHIAIMKSDTKSAVQKGVKMGTYAVWNNNSYINFKCNQMQVAECLTVTLHPYECKLHFTYSVAYQKWIDWSHHLHHWNKER